MEATWDYRPTVAALEPRLVARRVVTEGVRAASRRSSPGSPSRLRTPARPTRPAGRRPVRATPERPEAGAHD